MSIFLKQSTAVDLGIGPFVDSTDGVTAETALTLSQADFRLKKNNGNWAQKSDTNSATHEENGWYEVSLNSTDTNTVGRLTVAVNESGALPVWIECYVLEEAIYDALFAASATGALPLDLTQALDLTPTDDTVGDALLAALAQGAGTWTIVGTTLTLKSAAGTTLYTFDLDSASSPTSRTRT